MRPIGCVNNVNTRIETIPRKPITATNGNSARSPLNVTGKLNGILNLRGLKRVVKTQRDQREKDERVARRRAKGVQVGKKIQAGFVAEEVRVDARSRPETTTGTTQKAALGSPTLAKRGDRNGRRAKLRVHPLEHRRQQVGPAHRIGDARTSEHAGVRRDEQIVSRPVAERTTRRSRRSTESAPRAGRRLYPGCRRCLGRSARTASGGRPRRGSDATAACPSAKFEYASAKIKIVRISEIDVRGMMLAGRCVSWAACEIDSKPTNEMIASDVPSIR